MPLVTKVDNDYVLKTMHAISEEGHGIRNENSKTFKQQSIV